MAGKKFLGFIETDALVEDGRVPMETKRLLADIVESGTAITYVHDGKYAGFEQLNLPEGTIALGHGSRLLNPDAWQHDNEEWYDAVGKVADQLKRVLEVRDGYFFVNRNRAYSESDLRVWKQFENSRHAGEEGLVRVIQTGEGLALIPPKAGKGPVVKRVSRLHPGARTFGIGVSSNAHEFLGEVNYPMTLAPPSLPDVGHEWGMHRPRTNPTYSFVRDLEIMGRPAHYARSAYGLLRDVLSLARHNGHVPQTLVKA